MCIFYFTFSGEHNKQQQICTCNIFVKSFDVYFIEENITNGNFNKRDVSVYKKKTV